MHTYLTLYYRDFNMGMKHIQRNNRDGHQNLKLLLIDLNQMHLIGLVEITILVFKSSKSDVLLQSYGL